VPHEARGDLAAPAAGGSCSGDEHRICNFLPEQLVAVVEALEKIDDSIWGGSAPFGHARATQFYNGTGWNFSFKKYIRTGGRCNVDDLSTDR